MSICALFPSICDHHVYQAVSQHLIPRSLSVEAMVRSGATLGSMSIAAASLVASVAGPGIFLGSLCMYACADKNDASRGFVSSIVGLIGASVFIASYIGLSTSASGFDLVCANADDEMSLDPKLVFYAFGGWAMTAWIAKSVLGSSQR